jgi:hypothetical protein
MRRIFAVSLIAAVALSAGIARASSGSLTSFEYSQLISTRDKLKSADLKTVKGVNAALWDCEQIHEVTPLLTQERSDCVSQLRIGSFDAAMQQAAKTCGVYPSVSARLRCLLPVYRAFYTQAAIFYHSESRIRQIATARGLPGRCTTLLADTPHVVSLEERMVQAIGRIIRTAEIGKLYPFEAASGKALTVISEVGAGQQANNAPLSVCPHQ